MGETDEDKRTDIECLVCEIEEARAETRALAWCIQRMEHAINCNNVNGEIRQLIAEAKEWIDFNDKEMTELATRIQNLKEDM